MIFEIRQPDKDRRADLTLTLANRSTPCEVLPCVSRLVIDSIIILKGASTLIDSGSAIYSAYAPRCPPSFIAGWTVTFQYHPGACLN